MHAVHACPVCMGCAVLCEAVLVRLQAVTKHTAPNRGGGKSEHAGCACVRVSLCETGKAHAQGVTFITFQRFIANVLDSAQRRRVSCVLRQQ